MLTLNGESTLPSSRVLKLRLLGVYKVLCNHTEQRPVIYRAPHHIYNLYKQEIGADDDGVIRLTKIPMEITDGRKCND